MALDSGEILLVEDNPGDVRLTREALRESSLPSRLSVAGDGVEALAFLRREGKYAEAPRPDLILLDLKLPRKGGLEVLAAIKADERLKQIPVVVLSSSTAPDDISRAYQLQASCYVTKPADLDHYVSVVQSIEGYCFSVAELPPRSEGWENN